MLNILEFSPEPNIIFARSIVPLAFWEHLHYLGSKIYHDFYALSTNKVLLIMVPSFILYFNMLIMYTKEETIVL